MMLQKVVWLLNSVGKELCGSVMKEAATKAELLSV